MKILFIVPGSGDSFYCGNCFRDNLHAQALRKAGHDVVIMPLYLPLTDKSFRADTPLFFPATTFYVAHAYFRKKKMPRLIEKILESDSVLQMAASFSGTTSAKGMENITLSMIKGDDSVFEQQVNKLIDWIKECETPDVIHLSTSLLIGIAKAIKKEIKIPIVCSLQDEEVWIDSLGKKDCKAAWDAIAYNVKYADNFLVSSHFYKLYVQSRIPQIKDISVVYPGVDIAKYASDEYPSNPTIGFFYRMSHQNGLDILVDAFIKLKEKKSVANLKLKIGGGFTHENKKFVEQIWKKLAPYASDVDWCESYNIENHTSFYKEISIICVPIRFDEAVGLYLCEAFAAGRPAIEPNTGSFGEIVHNAGILYQPNESDRLAVSIEEIIINKELFDQSKKNALILSQERYNGEVVATKLMEIYKNLF